MSESMIGKKFIFAGIAIVFVSAVTIFLKYDAANYLELIKWICGSFLGAQALTDIVGKQKTGGLNV